MIGSYLKIALRNIKRNKIYVVLNVLGLTLGITCCITLGHFIFTELRYDTFFKDADRLYRVTTYFKRGDQEIKWAITNGGLVPLLQNDMSNVEGATKCMMVQSSNTFSIWEKSFAIPERTGFYVDKNFLSVLDFTVLAGVDSMMFQGPHSIVLTESFAQKLFGHTDVLGENITLKNLSGKTALTITGILQDLPHNSHMQFDYLFAGGLSPMWTALEDPKNGGFPVHVYFRATSGTSDSLLTATLSELTKPVYGENLQFPIQKVSAIHFHADNLFEHARKGNLNFIRILATVAAFILAIAIINYIILSTSHMLRRMKEVGVRKTIGATPQKITIQFLFESVLLTTCAGILAIALCEIVFQFIFPQWFDLKFSLADTPIIIPMILVLAMSIGVVAGIFPAVKALRVNTIAILRAQKINLETRKFGLRSLLVTIQFIFTLAIITGTLVVARQLAYLKTKNLGFSRDWVINIPRPTEVDISTWSTFTESIRSESVVQSASTTLYKFLSDYNATGIQIIDEINDTTSLRVQWNAIDSELVKTMDMQIIEGRNFSPEISSDSVGMLLNEAAARQLGVSSLSGKKVMAWLFGNQPGKIVGVIRDFHFQSFDKEIIPIAFVLTGKKFEGGMNLLVKLQPSDISETLNTLRSHWKAIGIEAPFEYTFMDESFETLIKRESQISNIILSFATLTVIISVLGLIGLVSYNTERMRKEIGIRKVFGASVPHILMNINRTFIALTAIAFVLAIPLSYYGINRWLETFVYKISVNLFDYLLAAAIFVVTIVAVITAQSWQAARANPTRVLKEE